MKNYAKVIDGNVVEIIRNTARPKPAGTHWKELEHNKPDYDSGLEVLVIQGYTVEEDKIIENYRIEPINFEPMPTENGEEEE